MEGVLKCVRHVRLLCYIVCFSFHFPTMYLTDYFLWADPYFSFIHAVVFAGALTLIGSFLVHTDSTHVTVIIVCLSSFLHQKQKEFPFLIHLSMRNTFVSERQQEIGCFGSYLAHDCL